MTGKFIADEADRIEREMKKGKTLLLRMDGTDSWRERILWPWAIDHLGVTGVPLLAE